MRIRIAILALCLAVLLPLCARVVPQVLPEWGAGEPAEASATGAARQPVALDPPAVPSEREPDARVVLFLPFLNHSDLRIHPTFLRAFDHTLAAFAGLFLDVDPVSPSVAGAIGSRMGSPTWYASPNRYDYAPEVVSAAARLAGAGTVVWGEITREGIRLRTVRILDPAPGGAPLEWDGLEVRAGPDFDSFLYDAPRGLIEALLAEGRLAAPTALSVRPEPGDAVADAMAPFWEGHPAAIRRAELALAQIAAARPGDAEPWVQLAFLRVVRPIAFGPKEYAALLREGPPVARHIARLLPDLTGEEAARLDLVDHVYLAHRQDEEAFRAVVESTPPGSIDRVVLAYRHRFEDRARFGLETAAAPGALGRTLVRLARAEGYVEKLAAAVEIAEAAPAQELLRNHLLLRYLREEADDRNDWGRRAVWNLAKVPAALAAALETLRAVCLDIPAADRAPCAGRLGDFLVDIGMEEMPADALSDDAAWQALADAAMTLPVPGTAPAELPDAVPRQGVLAEDPAFAATWYLTRSLVGASNRVLAEHTRALGARAPVRSLLVASPRQQLRVSVDTLLDSAYVPAWIGRGRAQRDEVDPYLEWLDPLSGDFATARFLRAKIRKAFRESDFAYDELTDLASSDPYDSRWTHEAVTLVDSRADRTGDTELRQQTAAWLASLVPLPHHLTYQISRLHRYDGEPERAIELLDAALARRLDAQLAGERDRALEAADAPAERRLALLESAVQRFPYHTDLHRRIGDVQLATGSWGDAEATFTKLLEDSTEFKHACNQLGEIARRRLEPRRRIELFAMCATRAPDKWKKASFWNLVGNARQNHDDFESAVEAHELALEQVGGAGWILKSLGRTHELRGDLDAAQRRFEQLRDIYDKPKNFSGRIELLRLALRRDDRALARTLADEIGSVSAGRRTDFFRLLPAVYLREDDLAGLRRKCQELGTPTSLAVLAESNWETTGDVEGSLALVGPLRERYADSVYGMLIEADILLGAGRTEEAAAVLARAREIEPTWASVQRMDLRIALARGEMERAASVADRALERAPYWSAAWELRARVQIAQGEIERARQSLKRGRDLYPGGGGEWWIEMAHLLEAEASIPDEHATPLDDARLARDLTATLKRLFYRDDLWAVLSRVQRRLGDGVAADQARAMAVYWNPQRHRPRTGEPVPAEPAP